MVQVLLYERQEQQALRRNTLCKFRSWQTYFQSSVTKSKFIYSIVQTVTSFSFTISYCSKYNCSLQKRQHLYIVWARSQGALQSFVLYNY